MQQDGPNCFAGPVRGTRGWWKALGKGTRSASTKTTTKKRKRGKRRSSAAPIRTELVARVRREIAAGTYDTPEKWHVALERLLDDLGG